MNFETVLNKALSPSVKKKEQNKKKNTCLLKLEVSNLIGAPLPIGSWQPHSWGISARRVVGGGGGGNKVGRRHVIFHRWNNVLSSTDRRPSSIYPLDITKTFSPFDV